MPTETTRIALKIADVFEGQAEGSFAIGILGFLALATLICATFLLNRSRG